MGFMKGDRTLRAVTTPGISGEPLPAGVPARLRRPSKDAITVGSGAAEERDTTDLGRGGRPESRLPGRLGVAGERRDATLAVGLL